MGHTITKEVDVEIDLSVDDIKEWISFASVRELKEVKTALISEMTEYGQYVEGKTLTICVPSLCHGNDLIAAAQLQELIATIGLPEALELLKNR